MNADRDAALAPPASGDPRVWQLFASALADRALALIPGQPEAVGRLPWPPVDEGPGTSSAAWRLALLRQVVAQQPAGRWSLDEASLTAARLWGPRTVPAASPDAPDDALARCLASWPRPVLLRRVFRALEAARVDADLARQCPGVQADLAHAADHTALRGRWASALQGLVADARSLAEPGATALDSLRWAIAWVQGGVAGGVLQAIRGTVPLPPLVNAGSGSGVPGGAGPADPLADPSDEEGLGDGASATGGSSGQTAEVRGQLGGGVTRAAPVDRQPAPAAGGEAALDIHNPGPAPAGPTAAVGVLVKPKVAPVAPGLQTQWHDEWDYLAARYRRAWTCVQMQAVRGTSTDYLAQLQARHAPLMRAIRRHFSATPPTARARGGPAADGDQIDLDQALANLIERRAGSPADARPYRHRPRLQRDVCTAVLLDTSGSTGFIVPPPLDPTASPPPPEDEVEDDGLLYGFKPRRGAEGPAPRRVIDIAHDAIALMCDGMNLLGDRHAIYGFSGQGRLNVEVKVAKDFDEPWSARTADALVALQPEGSTRTGAAIRFAVSQLLPQPAHTRVLVLVTDGYPQDRDYGPDPNDRRYGLHDTAQALREAARAGVAAFCISVDQAAHDYLRGVCPAHRYLVIDDIHRLPERLSRLYRRLTSV